MILQIIKTLVNCAFWNIRENQLDNEVRGNPNYTLNNLFGYEYLEKVHTVE